MVRETGLEIPDGYGDGTINSNPWISGTSTRDMLRSRNKGLRRQYPDPTRPIVMSSYAFWSLLFQGREGDHVFIRQDFF